MREEKKGWERVEEKKKIEGRDGEREWEMGDIGERWKESENQRQ